MLYCGIKMVNKHNFEKYQAELEITIGNNITETIKKLNEAITRGGSRDLKKGTLYVGRHGWPMKKILAKYFFEYFWIFSIFLCSKSLAMKSYQFFKICKRFYKKKRKNTHTAVNVKRKTEKSWTLFCNRLFYKAL